MEEIRVADDAVYAGRTLHQEREEPDLSGTEFRSFQVSSERLGLMGKEDAVRRRNGGWVPYEHKRGRAARDADGGPAAWPSDRLQVSAYGLLLEEEMGELVAEGRIRYHATGVTVRVALDDAARDDVVRAIERARTVREAAVLPPVTENPNLCRHCSLAPVCLPEEGRLARDPEWEPMRLFPPAPDGQVVHVISHEARVGRSANTLVVEDSAGKRKFPIEQVDSVVLHGNAQISTQALHLCGSRGIAVHWLTTGGTYIGGMTAGAGPVQRRIWQYEALRDPYRRLGLAKRLATAKIEAQLRYLLRATRGDRDRPDAFRDAVVEIRRHLRDLQPALDVDKVRGHEGGSGKRYFACLPLVLRAAVPDEMRPTGRTRRPPRDRFNALLSFGYALLYRTVHQAILGVGLEPAFGFFHTPRSAAHPLVLDLMELFRVALWDMVVIGSVNRLQWNPRTDFVVTKDSVWLSDDGRRKAIGLYEQRLQDGWQHPVVRYSLSYVRTVELEVRLLEKEWLGEPGLFARARLR